MLTRLLTILPLLLCPLLLLGCMWMMRNREPPQRQTRAGQQELPTAARVTQLERELAELGGRLPQAGSPRGPVDAATRPAARFTNSTPVPPGSPAGDDPHRPG
jgi:hypothetical protein